jgi:hypothetical protein
VLHYLQCVFHPADPCPPQLRNLDPSSSSDLDQEIQRRGEEVRDVRRRGERRWKMSGEEERGGDISETQMTFFIAMLKSY